MASPENGVESRLDGFRGMVVGEDVWPLGANGVDDVGCDGRWFDGADGVHARADASRKNNADPDRSLDGTEVGAQDIGEAEDAVLGNGVRTQTVLRQNGSHGRER